MSEPVEDEGAASALREDEHTHEQLLAMDIAANPPADGGLEAVLVQELLAENASPLSHAERRMPSRMLLWHAFDATHGPGCALQQVKHHTRYCGAIMSKSVRMAAALELYRKLTGDLSTPSKLVMAEADAIAKKRQAGANTPSASMRRWLNELPLSCSQQGPWCNEHLMWNHSCGCSTIPDALPRAASPRAPSPPPPPRPFIAAMRSPKPAPRKPGDTVFHSPGPGAYHTSSGDMHKNVRLASRPSPAFAGPTQREVPRGQSPGRQFSRPRSQTPPPGVRDLTALESIARSTRFKGQATAAFASRTIAHEDRVERQEDHGTLKTDPGPGAYEPELSGYEISQRASMSRAMSSRGHSGFASNAAKSSGVVDPKWLSGPLKPLGHEAAAASPFTLPRSVSVLYEQPTFSPSRGEPLDYEGSAAAAAAAAARVAAARRAYSAAERPRARSAPHARPSPEPFGLSEQTRIEARRHADAYSAHAEKAQAQAQARAAARLQAEREREIAVDRENEARLREAEARAAAAMAELAKVHEELNVAARSGSTPSGAAPPTSPFLAAPRAPAAWSPSVARATHRSPMRR